MTTFFDYIFIYYVLLAISCMMKADSIEECYKLYITLAIMITIVLGPLYIMGLVPDPRYFRL